MACPVYLRLKYVQDRASFQFSNIYNGITLASGPCQWDTLRVKTRTRKHKVLKFSQPKK